MYVRTCHHHHRRHHRRHQIYHHHQHHQHQQLLGLISTLSSIILISSIYSTSSSHLINNQHRRIVLFCPWLSTCNNRPAPATSGAYEVRSACHPPPPPHTASYVSRHRSIASSSGRVLPSFDTPLSLAFVGISCRHRFFRHYLSSYTSSEHPVVIFNHDHLHRHPSFDLRTYK